MSDADYFAARESAERALADRASSAKVREIHLKLAAKYAALAWREDRTDFLRNGDYFQARA